MFFSVEFPLYLADQLENRTQSLRIFSQAVGDSQWYVVFLIKRSNQMLAIPFYVVKFF
jgi:hypothetical protein